MPSEYTTPVLDFVALVTEQLPHQAHQQYPDHHHQQQQQQQAQQQQQQPSPSALVVSVPMSAPVSPALPLPLNSSLSTMAQTTPLQSAQAKICAICHCALTPESSEIVDVQGVPNIVCTGCIAGGVVEQHPRRHHQRQFDSLFGEHQSSLNHSPSDVPIPTQPHSAPFQFSSLIVIPPPSTSIPSVQNATPLLSPSVTVTQCQLTQPAIVSTLGSSPVQAHRSPPMPIGGSFLEGQERDSDEHADDERRHICCSGESESESDGENAVMLDDHEVQDSLGLDPGSSSDTAATSICKVDQVLSQSPALSQLGSFRSPSPSVVLPPLPSRQQPSPFSALPSRTQAQTGATVEPLAQTHPSSQPSTSPFSMSSLNPINSVVPSSSSSKPSSNLQRMRILEPDPLTDISRLRVRSHTQDCLYPGAQFCGTQKSGRNSYDVSVTIVDVDFQSSFLCGYLHIRDLTDDWPELTTYFDAQIIGSRYGFLTQDWGATETEDVTHWSRFPAYERVKPLICGPKMNIPDGANSGSAGRDDVESSSSGDKGSASASRLSAPVYGPGNGGCVFMRWKERFLVPDHRVRDINGASFAGFYYVCVEFNPARSNASLKRRRKKVEKKSSSGTGNHARRDVGVTVVREGEDVQVRDQIIFSAPSHNSNTNAKPPDTDVEMDEIENFGNVRRERELIERRFVGMEMDMDMDGRDALTPPSRSRSLLRGVDAVNSSRSRSRIRRRRRREEQYERYRENVVLGNTTASVAVPVPLSSSSPYNRRDHPLSHSLPLPRGGIPDDGCDDLPMSYRGWERALERERERDFSRERNRRGRMTERPSRLGMQDGQNSVLISQQNSGAAQGPITTTPTVVEPESEESGSEYEYEYEYDEDVYSDDPAYDDTLGSTPGGPYTATMSGYYFHQHSEPYQQLSLRYVPRRSTGSFEFR